MDKFSISEVSRFSGVKPHNIRMWEQRYNALEPNRSEGNTRYYSGEQLRRLLNIVSLMDYGYKISELGTMPDEKLYDLVKTITVHPSGKTKSEYLVSQLIASGMNFNEAHFEKIFAHGLLHYNMKEIYKKVIYPMLIRLGLIWQTNELPPAHEHFISNLIRQKIDTAINSLPPPEPGSSKWLLFLPENEFHELGLLFSNYFIRGAGKEVTYLGGNVPIKSLADAVKSIKPHNLLFFLISTNRPEDIVDYLAELKYLIEDQNIFIAARENMIKRTKVDKTIIWLSSVEELERLL